MAKLAGLQECADMLAQKRGISKSEAKDIMTDVVEIIATECKEGGVSFKGVFTIKKAVKKGRSGEINGHKYSNPDSNTLKITVGSKLSEEMN